MIGMNDIYEKEIVQGRNLRQKNGTFQRFGFKQKDLPLDSISSKRNFKYFMSSHFIDRVSNLLERKERSGRAKLIKKFND
jgi:hypothetical protein